MGPRPGCGCSGWPGEWWRTSAGVTGAVTGWVLWVADAHALELRGEDLDVATFRRLAEGLEEVDPETWLAAMPADVVTEGDRAEAVQDMLSDIPVPKGFDRASLANGAMTANRYELGAEVTNAVTCAWITQWDQATATGDTARAQEAVDAMATAPDWDILVEMQPQGAWPDYIWLWAHALVGGTGIGPNHNPIISFCTNR